ncbi:KCNH6 [Symbiodinium sp. KB8]|nr:KCNH6 [Symbiodinium sp. KB8]
MSAVAASAWIGRSHCRQVNDVTQVSLLLAASVGIILAIRDAVGTYQHGCIVHQRYGFRTFCVVELLDSLFLLPCTFQLICLTVNYDDRVQSRLQEAKQEKEQLSAAYHRCIQEMDEKLRAVSESNILLAERSFADRKRDFAAFLGQLIVWCPRVPAHQQELLRHELCSFVDLWLRVYGEASIDPDKRLQFDCSVLGKCKTAEELLRAAQNITQSAGTMVGDSYESHMRTLNALKDSEPPAAHGRREQIRRSLREPTYVTRRSSWWHCLPGRCYFDRAASEDRLVDLSCCICRLQLLSADHALLLLALLVGIVLIAVTALFPLLSTDRTWRKVGVDFLLDAAPVAIYVVCLAMLLARIERISALIAMRREVYQAQEMQIFAGAVKDDLLSHWAAVSDITDLWCNRTLPRLELLKELHCQLSSSSPEQLATSLRDLNGRLCKLEDAVGDVKDWWTAQHEGRAPQLQPRVSMLLRSRTLDGLEDGAPGSFSDRLDSMIVEISSQAARSDGPLQMADFLRDAGQSFQADSPTLDLDVETGARRQSLLSFIGEQGATAPDPQGGLRNLDSFCVSAGDGHRASTGDQLPTQERSDRNRFVPLPMLFYNRAFMRWNHQPSAVFAGVAMVLYALLLHVVTMFLTLLGWHVAEHTRNLEHPELQSHGNNFFP